MKTSNLNKAHMLSFLLTTGPGWAGLSWRFSTQGAFLGAGGEGGGWQQPLWIYVSLCSAQTCLSHISSKESISQMCTTVSHNYIRAQWQLAITWKLKRGREKENRGWERENAHLCMRVYTDMHCVDSNITYQRLYLPCVFNDFFSVLSPYMMSIWCVFSSAVLKWLLS